MTREESIHKAYKEHLLTEGNPFNGFEYGARWADAHPINPWHKASEELPKEDGVYLVKYSIGNYPITYPVVILYESGEWKNSHRLGDGAITITHWMEIPELPKED